MTDQTISKELKLFTFFFCLLSYSLQASYSKPQNRFEILSGVKNKSTGKTYWDKKYNKKSYIFGKAPAKFLAKNYHFIPKGAKVLDMGMGEGRNAVYLARKNYKVTGIDISSIAVKKARKLAKEFDVRINTIIASLERYPIKKESFDAIICFYYVDRDLHERMVSWLKPGGILIYEAHTDLQRTIDESGYHDSKYLLREKELPSLFPNLRILKYEEPLHQKEFTASIILQK